MLLRYHFLRIVLHGGRGDFREIYPVLIVQLAARALIYTKLHCLVSLFAALASHHLPFFV